MRLELRKRAREVLGLPFSQMIERVGDELERVYGEGMNAKEQELRLEIANLKKQLRGVQIELQQADEAITTTLRETGTLSLSALCIEFNGMKERLSEASSTEETRRTAP